jgi:hypothetical protein
VTRLHRAAALVATAAIFYLLVRRIPMARLLTALQRADYAVFFAAMIPNTLFYFCWDTLVLTLAIRWFHAPIRYLDLVPARAASYVAGFFNTNAGRGTLALHLSRRLRSPFLQLGSTVLFLVLSEYLHLVAWATIGILQIRSEVARGLLWGPPLVAAVWLVVFTYSRLTPAGPPLDPARRIGLGARVAAVMLAPRGWALMRTFRLAPARRYVQIVLLRAPMFFVSLCLHYAAARAFGLSIPFLALVAFLPVVFMIAALPITVARLGTTQAAWVFFFGAYGDAPTLLAFSLAAHLTFAATRALLGVAFLPRAYAEIRDPQSAVRGPLSGFAVRRGG